uniref:Carbohydrate kinase PfkB domain-containing protein n=1 Tax=Lactuca sativa TaxID=4236 RepID=A0A9R1VWE1_LACSA|nr:hypothetical protein LSAT_V11C400195420 [Lactuca sativa]
MTLLVLGKENNVNNIGMRFDKQARSGLAFVTLRADREREFMFFRHPNADMLLTEVELDTDLIQKDFHGKVGGVKVKSVDTTDACDAFVGGLLLSLAKNAQLFKDEKKLRDALRFTNICGAITVTERGAIPSLPSKEAVHKKLEESENK